MSHYCMVVAVDGRTGDRTAVGVVVFDADGRQAGRRLASLARARRRGDFPPDDPGTWVDEWLAGIETIDDYRRLVDSTGHCMSFLQVGQLSGSTLGPLDLLERIFTTRVIDEETGLQPSPGPVG